MDATLAARARGMLHSLYVGAAVAFLVAPLVVVVYTAFSPVVYTQFPPTGASLRWFDHLWQTPQLLTALGRSLGVAAVVVPLTGVLAIAAALGLEAARARTRAAGDMLFQAPLVVPQLIFGVALLQLYAAVKLADTIPGLVAAHVVVGFPFFVRAVQVSLAARDRALEDAAESLGATPLRVLLTVTLPSIRAGLVSGAVFTFVESFDQFTVSLFVVGSRTETLPVAIYNYLFMQSDPTVAAISTVVVAIGATAAVVAHRFVGLDRLLISSSRAAA